MQLSNIAREVGEDARAGRLYLPLRWLRGAGIEPDAWLARPEFDARLAAVVQRLLVEAERLYRRAGVGIDELPPSCRTGIHAARLLYAEIGREVERAGLDSVSRRAVVPLTRKLWLVLRALAASLQSAPLDPAASLPEARFLLDAVARTPPRPAALWLARPTPPWWRIEDRFLWVLALFDQLERREQAGRSATGP
jgi:phytoene synthase